MTRLEQLFDGQLPRLVMFDLDGTLMDSVPDLAAAVDKMLMRAADGSVVPLAGKVYLEAIVWQEVSEAPELMAMVAQKMAGRGECLALVPVSGLERALGPVLGRVVARCAAAAAEKASAEQPYEAVAEQPPEASAKRSHEAAAAAAASGAASDCEKNPTPPDPLDASSKMQQQRQQQWQQQQPAEAAASAWHASSPPLAKRTKDY